MFRSVPASDSVRLRPGAVQAQWGVVPLHLKQKKPKQGGQKLVIRVMAILLVLMFVLSLGSQIVLYANAAELDSTGELKAQHAQLSDQRKRCEQALDEQHNALERYQLLSELDELVSAQIEVDTALVQRTDEEVRWLKKALNELLTAAKDEEVVLECGQETLERRQSDTEQQLSEKKDALKQLRSRLQKETGKRADVEQKLSRVIEEMRNDPSCQEALEKLSKADADLEGDILSKEAQEESVKRVSSRSSEPAQTQESGQDSVVLPETGVDGDAVAYYAVQFIGCPYKWGGDSLTEGCDCSGFIKGVFQSFGIELPHFSGALQHAGTPVEYEEAQLGDLICYDGHVGIYLGNDKMVNAFDSKHGIIICSVNVARLVTVRRIV